MELDEFKIGHSSALENPAEFNPKSSVLKEGEKGMFQLALNRLNRKKGEAK
jgi:hypothetical protein